MLVDSDGFNDRVPCIDTGVRAFHRAFSLLLLNFESNLMAGVFGDELLFEVIDHHVIVERCLNHFDQLFAVEICPNIGAFVSHA